MKNFLLICLTLMVGLAATVPSGLVVCKKAGSVSIEFERGEVCSCDAATLDLAEKFCCDDSGCHDNESITSTCHEKNNLFSNDCRDTKIEKFDELKFFSNCIKVPVKVLKLSDFIQGTDKLLSMDSGLKKPVDAGKRDQFQTSFQQNLLIKRTSVLII